MIWCLGMYASASTWLFNATRQVAAAALPGTRIVGTYAETVATFEALDPSALNIVKTHHLDRAATQFAAGHATHIVISLRDPRDGVTSLMQHMRHSFPQALEKIENSGKFCAHVCADPRATTFLYETNFSEDPQTFQRLATMFNKTLPPATISALHTANTRTAINEKIAALEHLPTAHKDPRSGDIVDTDTHWHRHHANRTGEVGRYRRLLPPAAIDIIEARMGGFMGQFGYRGGSGGGSK
jgi:hypothetical protein